MKNLGPSEKKIVTALSAYKTFTQSIGGVARLANLTYDQAQKAVKSLRVKGKVVNGKSFGTLKTFRLSAATYNQVTGLKKAKKVVAGADQAVETKTTGASVDTVEVPEPGATIPYVEPKEEKATENKPRYRSYGGCAGSSNTGC